VKKVNCLLICLLIISSPGFSQGDKKSASLKVSASEWIDKIIFGPGKMDFIVNPAFGNKFLIISIETTMAGIITDENLKLFDEAGNEYRFVSVDPQSDSKWISLTYDNAPYKLGDNSSYGLDWKNLNIKWETFDEGKSRTTISWPASGSAFRLLFQVKENFNKFELKCENFPPILIKLEPVIKNIFSQSK
jgi:hypothetical protein